MTFDGTTAVLALVDHQYAEGTTADMPVPPNGSSVRAQEAWYQTLAEFALETTAEWRLLEAIVEVITQHDLVRDRWIAEGSPVTSLGSMQQEVESPALGTMRKLRSQEAALWKQLALPPSSPPSTRRPGRPTRSEGGGQWGAR